MENSQAYIDFIKQMRAVGKDGWILSNVIREDIRLGKRGR